MLSLPLADGRILDINVVTNKRARYFRLISGIKGVRAVVPANYEAVRLQEFVKIKADWIAKTSQYYDRLREKAEHEGTDVVYYLGKKYRYNIVKDRQSYATVSDNIKVITFHVTDRRTYKHRVQQWYLEQTKNIIAERLQTISNKMGLAYNKVSIKNQRSRWASCSSKRNLNFNLLLSAAPLEVIDYVVVHELAHTVEMNHSRRFWKIVERADPAYRKHRKWLGDHSPVIKVEDL